MTKEAAGRLRSPLALLATLLGVIAVLLSASAANATPAGSSSAQGGSKTLFQIGSRARDCNESAPAASSASVEAAYVFPLSVDPGSAYWATSDQPVGGSHPFVSGTASRLSRVANQQDPKGPALSFAGTHLAPGIYHVGVTCLVPVGRHAHPRGARFTAAKGSTDDTLIAITASARDPNGFTWSVCTTPPAQLAEAPVAITLPLVGVVVAGGFAALRYRRSRSRQSNVG